MMADFERKRLSLVVHEIRSPVAALSAIADFVSGAALEGTDRRELVRLTIAASRGIERVMADTTIASVRPEPLDVGQLVADAVVAARFTGGTVRAEIEPALPVVDGDPDRLRQALDNLLANAFAHSPEGGEVVVRARADVVGVVVSVSDSGEGIAVEEHARIFEPGVRLDIGRPGSGLGLAVARAIVEVHGGSLAVESAPGMGATFSLSLPARRYPAGTAVTR